MSGGGGSGGGGGNAGSMDDANISDVGLSLGGFSTVDDATAAQAAAQAEADAQAAAIGEMDAYAAQLDVSPVADVFNFFSPIDITKTHDQFGRGVVGLDVSVPSVVGSVIGGPLGGLALGQLGRGLDIDTNLSFSPATSYSGLGPGGVGTVGVESQGFSMSPGTPSGIGAAISSAGLSGPPSFDEGIDAGGDNTPMIVQPVATPTAVIENVAAPVVVAEEPIDTSLLMRPSTLNVAPANAPVAYSLLYPEQERRFQESFALRPGYYSGQLDTTGYQPVASLLI